MTRFKIFFLALILACVIPAAGVVGYNLYLDPDEIVSQSAFYPFMDGRPHRYKNAGIINTYEMDNIIVGGSLIQNLVPSEVEQVMGWERVFPLTVNGVNVRIISKTAAYALRKHDIKNVVISILPTRLALLPADTAINANAPTDFELLYDRNPLNDLLIFAKLKYHAENYRQKKASFRKLSEDSFPGISRDDLFIASKDLYQPYMRDNGNFNRPLFIGSIRRKKSRVIEMTDQHRKNLVENYERHLAPLIEKYPDTRFHFVFPPKTFASRKDRRKVLGESIAYLAKQLSAHKNVEVYSFVHEPFNADLRLFRDSGHAHIEVMRYLLQVIKDDKNALIPETVDSYVAELEDILAAYDIPEIWQTDRYGWGKKNPYPRDGYITYYDAARLTWGDRFSDALYQRIPRSPYLAEESYVKGEIKTFPALDASRSELENPVK